MQQSLATILMLNASLVLCQVLNNRQQNIDEFIDQFAQNRRNKSTTVQPIQNPNVQNPYQFMNGQNQGPMLTFGQKPVQEAVGQPSSSFGAVAYPSSIQSSSNRPTYNANPCGRAECVPYYKCANGSSMDRNGKGLLDIRFGQEDNTFNRHHPCPGLFETCCLKRSDKPIIPSETEVNVGCGIRNVNGVGFHITGDKDGEAQFGEFPWTVAILREERAYDGQTLNIFVCGGSIIHPGVILTAAHCVDKKEPLSLKIRAGEWDTQTNDEIYPHQERQVRDYIIHEDYRRGSQFNDIALLILIQPVDIAENVNVICLPQQADMFDGSRCIASGWGKDRFGANGRYQVILKRVELPIVGRDYCVNKLRNTRLGKHFQLHHSFICAGGELDRDTCKGDGGSPLVCHVRNGKYVQVGIVSWGIGCGENETPAVYTNVPLFRNWVDQQMELMRFSTSAYYL